MYGNIRSVAGLSGWNRTSMCRRRGRPGAAAG